MGRTFGDEDSITEIDGYTLVDAAATWRGGPLRVALSGRNLFSREYYFDANSESADPGPCAVSAHAYEYEPDITCGMRPKILSVRYHLEPWPSPKPTPARS